MAFWKKTTKEERKESDVSSRVAADAVRFDVREQKTEKQETEQEKKETTPVSGGAQKILGILRGSHMTEKTSAAAEQGTYVFRVSSGANKISVAHAVQRHYGVAVDTVRMLNTKEKARVRGRITGWKPGFKKAMVTLKQGQKIETL